MSFTQAFTLCLFTLCLFAFWGDGCIWWVKDGLWVVRGQVVVVGLCGLEAPKADADYLVCLSGG